MTSQGASCSPFVKVSTKSVLILDSIYAWTFGDDVNNREVNQIFARVFFILKVISNKLYFAQ